MSEKFCALFLFCALIFVSCDRGLEPPPPAPTLSGSVDFEGIFPPCDSVRILAVILIEAAPPYFPQELIDGFLSNSILPYLLASCSFRDTTYTFTVAPYKKYHYLGVAQNYDTNLYSDWRIVGFAHTDEDSARSFEFLPGTAITGADLRVRFDSLPRQPFVQ